MRESWKTNDIGKINIEDEGMNDLKREELKVSVVDEDVRREGCEMIVVEV